MHFFARVARHANLDDADDRYGMQQASHLPQASLCWLAGAIYTVTVAFGNFSGWIRKLVFGNFPVGFGNFPGCIRELVYSGNWDLVTKPLSSETFPGGFGNLYSETFPGGFGNFSGWIRKLARLDSETFPVGFGNLCSETFPGGFGNLCSETFPGGFGNFSGWIRKLARLDSETFPVGFRNLIQKLVFFARYEET